MQSKKTSFPNVWDIVEKFKLRCLKRRWKTCEHEDLVNAEGKYNYLIWTRRIHIDTFKKVSAKSHQYIKEGNSYKKVNISYLAWISQETVSEDVMENLLKNPSLLSKVALYDISPIYEGQPTCLKINETESMVFQEFERFLKEYGISCKVVGKTTNWLANRDTSRLLPKN